MLKRTGFKDVINLAGGIKAWNSNTAIGSEDLGLHLFSEKETLEESLLIAYSLEQGLRDFYQSMALKVKNGQARNLFEKLSLIEVKHQDRIFDEYVKITGAMVSRDDFAANVVQPGMEGGLTTEEYLQLYQPDLEVTEEVIGLAMAIEAQALDLYQRAADNAQADERKDVLLRIADEEREHLKQLGKLFENL